jgi:hypothetical protein
LRLLLHTQLPPRDIIDAIVMGAGLAALRSSDHYETIVEQLEDLGPSNDTILRAAGRRRK